MWSVVFKEPPDADTSSLLLNNTMAEWSNVTLWDDCVKPVETLSGPLL